MRTFAIDSNGNIDVSTRSLVVVDEIVALKEHIQQKYSMFLGEYFLDTRLGIPYYENILIKQYSAFNVETILKRVLFNIDEVYSIDSFVLDFETSERYLDIDFSCTTKFGELTSEVII